MKKLWLAMLAVALSVTTSTAAVPNTMTVQGRLLDNGVPMSGTHPTTFRIYDA